MTLPEGVMLPTEDERRQIFFWLKRISSYTAWHRMMAYYQAWADACEKSVRIASDKGWGEKTSLPESDLILILKGLAHFEEGVRRLRLGDKRVFKYDANGEFVMAGRIPSHWATMLARIEMGENSIHDEHTPCWGEFTRTLHDEEAACGESWQYILETQHTDDPAPVFYGKWLPPMLAQMSFPDPLPDVPDPRNNILIPTGKDIPCSGIWEPIDAPVKKGFSLFRDDAEPSGPFAPAGCMAYLHGGSPAPTAKRKIGAASDYADVTWRLLWRDDRYEDGTIPAEESNYVFLEPQTSATTPATEAATSSEVVFGETGQSAPRSGRWLVENDLHASVTLEAGEVLPQHEGHNVRWVLAER
jgi:hypothetical protein